MVQFEVLYQDVFSVLQMKCQDLKNQGMKNVTEEDIWRYFINKKWASIDLKELKIHEMVSDLFALSTEHFIAFREAEKVAALHLVAKINDAERNALLGMDDI
ncbi:MAG: hypothetical protein KBT36_11120 [Kurthia sp.]|nr:hypothetical protein [Candidatus Kurthia equi]